MKLGSISPSTLFFCPIVLAALGHLPLHINFRIRLLISTNNLLGFWLLSNWEELISWQSWVFLSLNINFFSSYLVLVWVCSPEFYGFPHVKVKVKSLSCVWLFATPWTVAYQAPQSMGFSRQEYWSGLPFPSPGHLPDPGIEPRSPAL